MRWLKLLWCWSVSVLATKASTYASVTLFALLLCPDTAAVSSVQKTETKPLPRILRMHADSAYRAGAGVILSPDRGCWGTLSVGLPFFSAVRCHTKKQVSI